MTELSKLKPITCTANTITCYSIATFVSAVGATLPAVDAKRRMHLLLSAPKKASLSWKLLGWLEPLLARVAANASHVVCPHIGIIGMADFHFHSSPALAQQVGGFDWSLTFGWHTNVRDRKLRSQGHRSAVEPMQ